MTTNKEELIKVWWHTIDIYFKDGTGRRLYGFQEGTVTINKENKCTIIANDNSETFQFEGVGTVRFTQLIEENPYTHDGGI
jgi:hypothetical protein